LSSAATSKARLSANLEGAPPRSRLGFVATSVVCRRTLSTTNVSSGGDAYDTILTRRTKALATFPERASGVTSRG
jgi:hypothetical protein